MIGLGTQDDFDYAQEFIGVDALTDSGVTFLWDPSFTTWQAFDVRTNSSMAVLSPDLSRTTDVFFGFGEREQQQVLAAAAQLSS